MKNIRTCRILRACCIVLICTIVSLYSQLLFSIVSPLWSMGNTDIDIMFTVGKGLFNGYVPYTDLYDQKGPIQFFLYGIASLFDYKGYIGVFIIEMIIVTIGLIFVYKIAELYVNRKPAIALTVLFGMVMNINYAGGYAGQVETLAFPMFAYAFYILIKDLQANVFPSKTESFILGLTSGIILWSKYSILGFYIGYLIVPVIIAIKEKRLKELFKSILFTVLGVITISIPILTYFAVNNSLSALFEAYFYNNCFLYTDSSPLYLRYLMGLQTFVTKMHSYVFFTLIWIIYVYRHKGSIKIRTAIICSWIGTFLLLFSARSGWAYYYKAFVIYNIFGLLAAYKILKYFINKIVAKTPNEKWFHIMVSIYSTIAVLIIYCAVAFVGNGTYYFETVRRYRINAEIESDILKYIDAEDVKYAECGIMDCGPYTNLGIMPINKYFTTLNILRYEIIESTIDDMRQYKPNAVLSYMTFNTNKYVLVNTYNNVQDAVCTTRTAYLYIRADYVLSDD